MPPPSPSPPLPPSLAAPPRAWLSLRTVSVTVVLALVEGPLGSGAVTMPPPRARPPLPPLAAPPTAWLPVSVQSVTMRKATSDSCARFEMGPPTRRARAWPPGGRASRGGGGAGGGGGGGGGGGAWGGVGGAAAFGKGGFRAGAAAPADSLVILERGLADHGRGAMVVGDAAA